MAKTLRKIFILFELLGLILSTLRLFLDNLHEEVQMDTEIEPQWQQEHEICQKETLLKTNSGNAKTEPIAIANERRRTSQKSVRDSEQVFIWT